MSAGIDRCDLSLSLVHVSATGGSSEQRDVIGCRQRRASESDTQLERTSQPPIGSQVMTPQVTTSQVTVPQVANPHVTTSQANVDIMQILCRAQDEYDKVRRSVVGGNNSKRAVCKTGLVRKMMAWKVLKTIFFSALKNNNLFSSLIIF